MLEEKWEVRKRMHTGSRGSEREKTYKERWEEKERMHDGWGKGRKLKRH